MPDGPRYEDDFYAWTQYQADVLRALPSADNRFDREHVAEEIEDLGKNERDTVRSQVTRVLEHLLKLAHSPAASPRYGWMGSIVDARAVLRNKLTGSLRRDVEATLAALYEDARERAALGLQEHGEHAAAARLPDICPYAFDQILTRGWYPEPPGETE
ncbi:MAG TPA: DUF29 domain-containing protein [Stellaceae bacterium]|jgi:hypothetical protein|nr:DUF29 domain-containing protein [Stellaceae bacterium]